MAAALPFLTSAAELLSTSETKRQQPLIVRSESADQPKELLEIAGVFRGRELTRKERRLGCGIIVIDRLIGGGIVRGRISEIIGNPGVGKTSLAAAFAASVTARGEVAAWIDVGSGFDPASIAAAGVDLARMLWVAMPADRNLPGSRTVNEIERDRPRPSRPAHRFENFADELAEYLVGDPANYSASYSTSGRYAKRSTSMIVLKATEWILTAGGFGLVVIDCGGMSDKGWFSAFTQSAALRLAHGAERSGAAVLVIAPHRMCGTFAALSLMLSRNRACFSRACSGAPVLFDGLTIEARVTRNKLGGSGGVATWMALADPSTATCPATATCPTSATEFESALTRPLPHSSHLPHSSNLTKTAQSAGRRAATR